MYKEWEYIHNSNIKGCQSYSWVDLVLILDETDGGRKVMLQVKPSDMTPDVWREVKK